MTNVDHLSRMISNISVSKFYDATTKGGSMDEQKFVTHRDMDAYTAIIVILTVGFIVGFWSLAIWINSVI